jgi:hypothetical protein
MGFPYPSVYQDPNENEKSMFHCTRKVFDLQVKNNKGFVLQFMTNSDPEGRGEIKRINVSITE